MKIGRYKFMWIKALIIILFLVSRAEATIYWELDGESGVCDDALATGVFDSTESGSSPYSLLTYRCDVTPPDGSNYMRGDSHGADGEGYGTSTSTGTNTLTDSTKTWTTNEWGPQGDQDYCLIDSAGTMFAIASNTATTLTVRSGNPASGAYYIGCQHDFYNTHNITQVNMSNGTTYYLGMFFRFDRRNGLDIWADTNGPDTYDKYFELDGGIRVMFMAGWPNDSYSACDASACNGKYTMGVYLSCSGCDQDNDGGQAGCCAEKVQNISPYSSAAPRFLDYGTWYAGVLAVNPSTNGSTSDGTIDFYINGERVFGFVGVTQNNSSPYVDRIGFSGTVAQPGATPVGGGSNIYNAAPHYRLMDQMMFANSLTDMENAGLMEDPEAGGGVVTVVGYGD